MPFLKDLVNNIPTFPYYSGVGNFQQTSLPYSDDLLGGGYSGQPYIQVGINPDLQYSLFDDGLIRGGVINSALSIGRDVTRLVKFFGDTKNGGKGALFLTKQFGLQLSNPRFELLAGSNGSSVESENGNANITYNRVYNPLDVITNAATSPLGLHYDQNGIFFGQRPYGGNLSNGESGTATLNKGFFDQGNPLANRLVSYYYNISGIDASALSSTYLQEYNGGPDSVYGLGKTIIQTTPNTYGKDATTDYDKLLVDNGGAYGNFFTYQEINNFNVAWTNRFNSDNTLLNSNYNVDFKDFRYLNNPNIGITDYPHYNIENRIGTSTNINPAYKNNIGTNNSSFQNNIGNVDSINTINILPASTFYNTSKGAKTLSTDVIENFQNGEAYKEKLSGYFARDIIKFRIEVNNNDKPGSKNNEVLAFRAYIDTMDDDFEAKWNEYRYMGRGEPFYVYEGFTRDISLTFTVFAHTAYEMAPLWNKMNYLMSSLAPDYNKQLLMRGNYHYLTIGDYIYRQPGIITSLRLSNFFDNNWELGLNEPEGLGIDTDQYELPKSFKVALNFKPIHTFVPRRNTIDKYTAPFITPDIKAYEYGFVEKQVDNKPVYSNKYLPITKNIN